MSKIERFFRDEYRKLVSYAKKNMDMKYSDASPEDIIQDVALSLLSRLKVDDQIENLAAYIYRSIRNKILDNNRTIKYNKSFDRISEKHEETASIIDNEPFYMKYETNDLKLAIEKLNEDERNLLISTQFDGKSFKELSQQSGIPIGTLLSKQHRAQQKLRKILTDSKIVINQLNKEDYE